MSLTNTSETTILTNLSTSNKALKVTLITVANIDGTNNCDVSIKVYSAATGGTAFSLAHTITVPADATFAPLGRDQSLWLEEDRRITVQASAASDLNVIVSYEEVG